MIKIIFLSEEDTCQGPLAENIMKATLPLQSDFNVMSRGRVVLFPEPYNQQVSQILARHGMNVSENIEEAVTVPFSMDEVDENTLILTMTMQQKIKMMEEFSITENIFSLMEFVGEEGDVPDPYGGSEEDYEKCFVELERLVKLVIRKFADIVHSPSAFTADERTRM